MQGGVAGAMLGGVKQGVLTAASHIGLRTHFVCDKCGKRFRNPQELKKEADKLAKISKFRIVVGIVVGLVSLICMIWMFTLEVTPIAILFGIFAFIGALMIFISKAQAQKPLNELKQIEEGVRRFGGSI